MREIIYESLTSDQQLLDLIPKERWLENSAGLDIPVSPFAVQTWGPHDSPMRALPARTFGLYVHDNRGGYNTLDSVLSRATDVILSVIDVQQGDSHVAEATFLGASGDLDDPEYKTNMRYVEFRIAGR